MFQFLNSSAWCSPSCLPCSASECPAMKRCNEVHLFLWGPLAPHLCTNGSTNGFTVHCPQGRRLEQEEGLGCQEAEVVTMGLGIAWHHVFFFQGQKNASNCTCRGCNQGEVWAQQVAPAFSRSNTFKKMMGLYVAGFTSFQPSTLAKMVEQKTCQKPAKKNQQT